jgi:hypothetical protein
VIIWDVSDAQDIQDGVFGKASGEIIVELTQRGYFQALKPASCHGGVC